MLDSWRSYLPRSVARSALDQGRVATRPSGYLVRGSHSSSSRCFLGWSPLALLAAARIARLRLPAARPSPLHSASFETEEDKRKSLGSYGRSAPARARALRPAHPPPAAVLQLCASSAPSSSAPSLCCGGGTTKRAAVRLLHLPHCAPRQRKGHRAAPYRAHPKAQRRGLEPALRQSGP